MSKNAATTSEAIIVLSSDDEESCEKGKTGYSHGEPEPKRQKIGPSLMFRGLKIPKVNSPRNIVCLRDSGDENSSDKKLSNISKPEKDSTKEPHDEPGPKIKKITPTLISKKSDSDVKITVVEDLLLGDEKDNCPDSDLLMVTRIERVEPEVCPNDRTTVEKMTCDSTSDKLENIEKPTEKDESGITNDVTTHTNLEQTENLPAVIENYLENCRKSLDNGNIEVLNKKFPKMIEMFTQLKEEFNNSQYLINYLQQQTTAAKTSTKGAIISFKDVYSQLKVCLRDGSMEMSEQDSLHAKKLKETIDQLMKKLKELDEAEVDFDDEDDHNSNYIKRDVYSKRLCDVYAKYCEILKRNPYAGRLTHEQLKFVSSNYRQINLAITKKYRNNSVFPNYDDFSKYIQKVAAKNKLQLNFNQLETETQHCFKKLGDLLQTRRKKDLYEAHCSLILDKEDPADNDKELDRILRNNYREGKEKIENICEEFIRKQELGVVKEDETTDNNEEDSEDSASINEDSEIE